MARNKVQVTLQLLQVTRQVRRTCSGHLFKILQCIFDCKNPICCLGSAFVSNEHKLWFKLSLIRKFKFLCFLRNHQNDRLRLKYWLSFEFVHLTFEPCLCMLGIRHLLCVACTIPARAAVSKTFLLPWRLKSVRGRERGLSFEAPMGPYVVGFD